MKEIKDTILSDAIKTCIELERSLCWYKLATKLLSGACIVLIIYIIRVSAHG